MRSLLQDLFPPGPVFWALFSGSFTASGNLPALLFLSLEKSIFSCTDSSPDGSGAEAASTPPHPERRALPS